MLVSERVSNEQTERSISRLKQFHESIRPELTDSAVPKGDRDFRDFIAVH